LRTLSVAALQTAPVPGDPEATLRALADRLPALRATAPHAQLIVLPELHLAALPLPSSDHAGYAAEVATEVPGPLTDSLAALAREAGVWLVPGSIYERADGRLHNTVVVFSPAGELVARYRKVFPWQPHESCVPGDRFTTFDIPDVGRIGLAICYDGNFPETFRQLAWMGAEAVVQPTLTTTSDRDAELVLARANAIFNQLYVVSINAAAPAGLGRSLIVDPEGIVRLAAGDSEELITDVLDLDAVSRVRRFGTAGVSRMWEQIERQGPDLELPVYGGRFRPHPD
jgi:predicted amidohydrolase